MTTITLKRDTEGKQYIYHASDGKTFVAWKENDNESDWFGFWRWDRADFLELPDGKKVWTSRNSGDYWPQHTLGAIRDILADMYSH